MLDVSLSKHGGMMNMKNRYVIENDTVTIFLNRRDATVLETLIDLEDLEKVNAFPNTWLSHWDTKRHLFYCDGKLPRNGSQAKRISLHRYILDPPSDIVIDHINHNPLDNRKSNLRLLTNAQNCQNKNGMNKNNVSGMRGVSWNNALQRWKVSIRKDYKYVYQRTFKDLDEAKKAAQEAINKFLPYAE